MNASAHEAEASEERRVLGNPAASGGAVEHQQGGNHSHRTPAPLSGNHRTNPGLAVDPRQQLLRVHDDRLHFGDQQHAGSRMPRQNVDAAALAVVVERHLDIDQPTEFAQAVGPRCRQTGVIGVQEARHVAAGHAELEDNFSSTSHDSLAQCLERVATDVPRFQAGDHRSRNASSHRKI